MAAGAPLLPAFDALLNATEPLAEFARKATVTAEDVESCRADLRTFEARGWSITDHHARLDKLTTATARMAR
jgi:hypothetical protein